MRPHRVLQRRVPGDDVDRLPAVGDDAVHHLPGRQLLPQQPDGHLRDGHRVGGVDSQIRRDGGMRFLAAVVHDHLGQRQRAGPGDVGRPGMHHHRHGDVVERPGLQHQCLAAAGLLGGSSQQRHRQAQVVGHLGQRQRGAHRRRGDDVVAARVADLGQRVVFGADPDDQRSAAEVGAKGGVQARGGRGDLETALGDQRLRLGAAAVFVERQLRLGVDGVGQLDQIAATAPHHVLDDVECDG